VNEWLIAAMALLVGFVPCGVLLRRGSAIEGLVALEMAAVLASLDLILLAQGVTRPAFFELALVLAALSFPGSLVFVHFLERWI
jgi:multisubunit Na+/H+ antiporter MnhF subunit